MKCLKINTKTQENGLYGVPLKCYSIDGFLPIHDSRKYMLFSAIISLVDELYDTEFKIIIKGDNGFYIELHSNKYNYYQKEFFMSYNKYEYADGKIYIFEDEKERLLFLRKIKLENLEDVK